MPGKSPLPSVMFISISTALKKKCGPGTVLLPVIRISADFSEKRVEDRAEVNAGRILMVCGSNDSAPDSCGFHTSAMDQEKPNSTWYTTMDWTGFELEMAYHTDKCSLMKADPEGEDVYYVLFEQEDMWKVRDGNMSKLDLVEEATKRLVRSISNEDYNLYRHAGKGKVPTRALLRKAFKYHMIDELLSSFRKLFCTPRDGAPHIEEWQADCPVARESALDMGSADIFIAGAH